MTEDQDPTHELELAEQPGMTEPDALFFDVNSPEFVAELRRQVKAVAESEEEKDDLAFIDSLFNDLPWWQEDSDWDDGSET